MTYNFSSENTQAYGNNIIQVDNSPVRFAIYSGDVNQDGIIDAGDLSDVDNDAFNSVSGYVRTDVNGDNFVDASDLSIVDNNAYNGIVVRNPIFGRDQWKISHTLKSIDFENKTINIYLCQILM